jgi:hypothetical protein
MPGNLHFRLVRPVCGDQRNVAVLTVRHDHQIAFDQDATVSANSCNTWASLFPDFFSM